MSDTSKLAQHEENATDSKESAASSRFDFYEIDLLDQLKKLWAERRTIFYFTVFFTLFGLFHYHFGPTDYESEAILIQETEGGGGGDSGSALLRTLTGGSLGVGGSVTATARGYAPPPLSLYPSIVNSTGFQKELIYRDIEFATLDTTMNLFTYFTEYDQPPLRERVYSGIIDYTIKLPFTLYRGIRGLFRRSPAAENGDQFAEEILEVEIDDRLLSVTGPELSVINQLRTRITLSIGSGLTTVSTRLPDPKAAALVNALLVERIQEYMTEYRIEKARQNLEFVLDQHQEARERYEEAQLELARYRDQNINLTSAIARTEQEHLADQRNLTFNVYSAISEQVEQARLTLQQQTPVFNILEKSNIPSSPYTGASNVILVFSIVLGFFAGIGWVIGKKAYYTYKTGKANRQQA